MTARDPFDIPAKIIPRGKVYQWVAVSLMGQPRPYELERAIRNGWRRVPLRRHAKLFPSSTNREFVEIEGLALLEIAEEKARERRLEETIAAAKMADLIKCFDPNAVLMDTRDRQKIPIISGPLVSWPLVDYPYSPWRERNASGRLARAWIRLCRRVVCLWWGLDEGEYAASLDGTIRYNNSWPYEHSPTIGPKEFARRKRIMRERGMYT